MERDLARRLSFEDAAFINFERPEFPLNVASVGIYEGHIPYAKWVEHVDRRIDLVPRYKQRLMPAPLGLVHPAWIDDPEFDIHNHLGQIHLDKPGDDAQLRATAGEFFARPLERNKPLWEMKLITGLAGGRTAHIAKVHHCMVDGVSGVELLAALLDFEPQPQQPRRKPRKKAAAAPDAASQFTDAIAERMLEQMRFAERVMMAWLDPLGSLRRAERMVSAFGRAGTYLSVPAPATPWNHKLTSPDRLSWGRVRFQDVRAASKMLGGTINDVVLTTLAGAIGRYLESLGQHTEHTTLRVTTPVNVRSEDEGDTLGNRVSFMLAALPVGVRDPLERFDLIHGEISSLKSSGQAQGLDALSSLLGDLPPLTQAFVGHNLSMPNTISNLICTNVPGPLVPLYCMGHRLVEHYPWVPLGWRMGLSLAVMSYDRDLAFSYTIDKKVPGDVDALGRWTEEAFRALCDRIGLDMVDDVEAERAAPASSPVPAEFARAPSAGDGAAPEGPHVAGGAELAR